MDGNPRRKRRAFLLLETLAAGLLLGLAMVMTVRLLAWTGSERRSSERRGWAVQEAANAMEVLTAMPFDRLTPESARAVARLSPAAKEVLPESRLESSIQDEPEGMKRIDIAVSWQGSAGVRESPVRVTAWVARKEPRP